MTGSLVYRVRGKGMNMHGRRAAKTGVNGANNLLTIILLVFPVHVHGDVARPFPDRPSFSLGSDVPTALVPQIPSQNHLNYQNKKNEKVM